MKPNTMKLNIILKDTLDPFDAASSLAVKLSIMSLKSRMKNTNPIIYKFCFVNNEDPSDGLQRLTCFSIDWAYFNTLASSNKVSFFFEI